MSNKLETFRPKGTMLEYIRARLYLMACSPKFEEMVDKKFHLFLDSNFNVNISRVMGLRRRRIGDYYRIARCKLKAIEDKENKAFFEGLAKDHSLEFGIELELLSENEELLYKFLNEFSE